MRNRVEGQYSTCCGAKFEAEGGSGILCTKCGKLRNGSDDFINIQNTKVDTLAEPEHQNSEKMILEEIDEIVLKPAYWRLNDYIKARHAIKELIAECERVARFDELKEAKNAGFIDEDYLVAFEMRLSKLQHPQEAKPGKVED